MDISRISDRFIKENHLVGLGFPAQGYIFYRVNGVETIYYNYDEVGSIAADTQEDVARLGISADNIDNLLRVDQCNHIYQVFMGWQPGAIRQYLSFPYETVRRNIDVRRVKNKGDFGYIDGFDSPWDCPSPDTELLIPYKVDVGFAWYNPLQQAESLEINLVIRRLSADVLRDVDLIDRILKGSQPCRLATLGGVSDSFGYQSVEHLKVDFVGFNFTKDQIQKAVG